MCRRNHLVEAALDAATAGDMTPFEELVGVVSDPFTERDGAERYTMGAPADFGPVPDLLRHLSQVEPGGRAPTLRRMLPVADDLPDGSVPDALAAIDIGTNSVHMLIARVAANDRFEVVTRQKEMVRLGSGQGEMKVLEPDAIERGVAALDRCRSLADSFDAPVYTVATSAVREATNAEEFLRRARDEAGVDVQVISGYEEARLIQLGVLQALPVFDQRLALVDVGGGSTEVLSVSVVWRAMPVIKLGSLRMTRRFFPDGAVEGDALARCRTYVRGRLAPMVHDTAQLHHDIAGDVIGHRGGVGRDGAGPTRRAPAAVAQRRHDHPHRAHQGDRRARRGPTTEERRKLEGVDPSRADILVGGGVVLEQVCEALGIEELTFSGYALREGVLLDALHRLRGGTLHHLSDLRRIRCST